ncbi:MAG: hypothetical protein MRY59_00545 [Aquisalinus sp.]|nr:hypothetical protein [Aquisalinus sp.]
MKKIIVHIGYPKCGSSAIQYFLCHNQILHGENTEYRYFVMGKEGILCQQQVMSQSRRSLSGYVASVGSLSNALIALQDYLAAHEDNDFVPIISQEGWGSNDDIADLKRISEDLNGKVELHIVGYVRPQISWLQSAWWQWYAWRGDDLTLDKAWKWLKHTVKWHARLQRFQDIPMVSLVTPRLQDDQHDIATDFLELLGVEPASCKPGKKINLSVSQTHISIYRRLPWLRPPHDSRMDHVIQRLLPHGGAPPFVISRAFATEIIEEVRQDNIALADSLDISGRQRMMDDMKWWSVEAYAERWADRETLG